MEIIRDRWGEGRETQRRRRDAEEGGWGDSSRINKEKKSRRDGDFSLSRLLFSWSTFSFNNLPKKLQIKQLRRKKKKETTASHWPRPYARTRTDAHTHAHRLAHSSKAVISATGNQCLRSTAVHKLWQCIAPAHRERAVCLDRRRPSGKGKFPSFSAS